MVTKPTSPTTESDKFSDFLHRVSADALCRDMYSTRCNVYSWE